VAHNGSTPSHAMVSSSDTALRERPDPLPTFRAAWRLLTSRPFWRRSLRRAGITLLACAGLGYLSNLFAATSCERDTRDFLAGFFSHAGVSRPLAWVSPTHLTDVYARGPREDERIVPPWTWRSRLVGLHMYFPPDTAPLPWAYAFPASQRLPFVVTIHYGCLAKDLYGQAGVRIYLAFFRWHVLLAQWPVWFS
jgi:hypothetical protein